MVSSVTTHNALLGEAAASQRYGRQLETLAIRRNAILVQHGRAALDFIQYDADRTAKAAAKEVRVLRRESKSCKEEASPKSGGDGGNAVKEAEKEQHEVKAQRKRGTTERQQEGVSVSTENGGQTEERTEGIGNGSSGSQADRTSNAQLMTCT
ncbi:hypothetical protein PHYPSEUDO_005937 [Phytophthora pseudosyringae]|uniref:Uncharacterized protein n=1 Tax=Phytophthora pseudosyringae TaxID=221518 RepID=A0A8T1VQ60_9STRA|nr:hypothetical protein PHYPSEUDO_005937 [Phytophthora pseudosyringae]